MVYDEVDDGFGVESDQSLSDNGDNPQKRGHLILLDGPNLGADRKTTPFLYQADGRVGRQNYSAILERMNKEGNGKLFKDPKFPTEHALFDPRITEKLEEGTAEARRKRRREVNQHTWRNVKFVRLREYYRKESNFTLFNQINPSDISQGALADSYLLAVLCSMAEQQTRIVDLFVT